MSKVIYAPISIGPTRPAVEVLPREHERIANQRRDFLSKLSHRLLTTHGPASPLTKLREMITSATSVTTCDLPCLRGPRIASRQSALQPDKYSRKPPVQFATGRCRAAHRGPCRSSGATGCRPLDPPGATRSRAAPSRRSGSDGCTSDPAGTRHCTPGYANTHASPAG